MVTFFLALSLLLPVQNALVAGGASNSPVAAKITAAIQNASVEFAVIENLLYDLLDDRFGFKKKQFPQPVLLSSSNAVAMESVARLLQDVFFIDKAGVHDVDIGDSCTKDPEETTDDLSRFMKQHQDTLHLVVVRGLSTLMHERVHVCMCVYSSLRLVLRVCFFALFVVWSHLSML